MSAIKITIGTKANGIHYLNAYLPDPLTGDLKRARVSLDTRDMGEAKLQRGDWLAGRHPKHPAMGGVIAAKGRAPLRSASTSGSINHGGMTLACWLDLCQSTLWRQCKSQRTIESNVRILSGVIPADLLLASVASVHIGAIERSLRERHNYAEGSVKKLMGALSAALNHAVDTDDPATGRSYLPARPKFPKFTVRNTKDRVLSEAEEEALFACIEARITAEPARPWRHMGWLLRVLLDTGFRIGEALGLGPRSVSIKRWHDRASGQQQAMFLSLPRYSTKNDKPRDVPATDRIEALVPLLNSMAVGGRWFPWGQGSGGPGYMWVNLRADMAARGHDLSDVTIHTLRHTCATRLCLGGMDLVALRDWLGHTDIKITAERYVHLISTHLHQGAVILNHVAGSVPAPRGIETSDSLDFTMSETLSSGRGHADHASVTLQ